MKPLLAFDDAGASDDEPVKGVTVGDIRAWHDSHEVLRLRLMSILEWHRNWDAPFHEDGEWIEDHRLALEAVRQP